MKIEGVEIVVPTQTLLEGGGAAHQRPARQEPPARAPSPRTSASSSAAGEEVTTYGPAKEVRPPEETPKAAETAEMFSKLSGLWSTFRDMGIIPPPRSYAGFKVVTPAEVVSTTAQPEDTGAPRPKLSSADQVRIVMIRKMLERAAAEDPAAAESGVPEGGEFAVHTQGVVTDPTGQSEIIRGEVTFRGDVPASLAGAEAREDLASSFEVHLDAPAGDLPEGGTLKLELEFDRQTDRDLGSVDGTRPEGEGQGVRVWSVDAAGGKTLAAVGRVGQGALYVGPADGARHDVMTLPHPPGLSPLGREVGVESRAVDTAI